MERGTPQNPVNEHVFKEVENLRWPKAGLPPNTACKSTTPLFTLLMAIVYNLLVEASDCLN